MSKEDVAKFLELASRFGQLAARERDLDLRRKYAQRATLLRELASAREKE